MGVTQTEIASAKTKRRWLRFRLRTMFALVTAFAILMGWIAMERIQSQQEREIAMELEKQGVYVVFDGPIDSVEHFIRAQPQGWWRTLARQTLGDRILHVSIGPSEFKDLTPLASLKDLQSVYLQSTPVSDLTPLAGLENLQELVLGSTHVSDLTPLAGLRNLRELRVSDMPVSDLTPLAGLKKLQWLELISTQVTDLTPLAGASNLQWLHLRSTPVSDVTPLAGLKNLQELYLDDMPMSDEQVKSLQQALPNCRIVR